MIAACQRRISRMPIIWMEGKTNLNLVQDVLNQVGGPLRDVEQGIRDALSDASAEAQRVTRHLTDSGGKRIRPILTLLSGRLFSSDVSSVVPVGVASELI